LDRLSRSDFKKRGMIPPMASAQLLGADFMTAFCAAVTQNPAATDRLHATTKTMNFLTFSLVRLKSALHLKPACLGVRGEP
jgi:hypothetical protein